MAAQQETFNAPPTDAPAAAPAAGQQKPTIDQKDVDDWKNRFNEALADTSKITAPGTGEKEWSNSFWGCCSPIDTCLITYCLPCVTFGKIHHRTRKNATMEDYSPINTSCLLFFASACFGLHWIPESLQRQDIRHKYNLQGSCLGDIARACCCALCDLTQQEKETALLVGTEKHGDQYSNDAKMSYGA